MSRHYNGRHPERGRKRPRKFGRLEDADVLRARQLRRVEQYGSPYPRGNEREAA